MLLELQRTRQSIVSELNRLDPSISADSWMDVQDTIASYQSKITRLAAEETVDGRTGRIPALSGSKSVSSIPHLGGGASIAASSVTYTAMSSPSKYQTVTADKRNAIVRAAAEIPANRIRTGLDMLPVLSLSGESSLDQSLRKQGDIRLPVFKLPSIDVGRVADLVSGDDGLSQVLSAVASAVNKTDSDMSSPMRKRFATDVAIILRSERPVHRTRFHGLLDFTAALLADTRALSPMELQFFKAYLRMTDSDLHGVEDELERRVMLRVVGDSDQAAGGATVFLKCRYVSSSAAAAAASAMSALPRAASPNSVDGGGSLDGLGSMSVVTMGTWGTTGYGGGALRAGSRVGASSPFHTHGPGSVRSAGAGSRASRGSKGGGRSHASAAPPVSPADALKAELLESLRSMQHSTDMVKDGIAMMQKMGLSANPKARQRLFAVAAERLSDALSKISNRDLERGFRAWCLVLWMQRRRACCSRTVRLLSLRRLGEVLASVARRCMERLLVRWINATRKETARITRFLHQQTSVIMQRYMRGCLARDFCNKLRENRKYRQLYAAVVKIQAQIKGRLVKWRYFKFTKARREDRAARRLQRVQRGYRARKRTRWLRAQKNRLKATITIQALARGRRGRIRVRGIRADRHRWNCTIKIQSVCRGFVARRRVREIAAEMHRDRSCRRIQAVWRGAIARMSIARRKRELREYREMRYKAALDVQRVFRGFRSRMTSRMRQIEKERKKRKLDQAATKIQTMCRGFIARYTVRKLKKKRAQQWLDDAKSWVEQWSEDAEAFFYFNALTNETLWEPPKSGYTKVDGSLILANGDVVEDPDAIEAEEEERKRQLGQTCSECNQRVAIKMCKECGDTFCTPCYRTCHAAGARKLHTHEPLGPLDCSECEEVLAERWCVSCDEAFCDGCWRRVHGRGKRRFHPFSEVSARGKVDSRVFTMDGAEVSTYDGSYAQNQQEQAVDAERINEAQDYIYKQESAEAVLAAQWAEYADDYGTPYWYNSVTGESSYESPYG